MQRLLIETLTEQGFSEESLKTALSSKPHYEPIYGPNGRVVASECLARPHDGFQAHHISNLSETFYVHQNHINFDLVATANALHWRPDNTNITINISVQSALSEDFWKRAAPMVEAHKPKHILFEILEHDVNLDADITPLRRVQEQFNYRFALDDLSVGQAHDNRLAVFGDVVDFVKFDGPLIRGVLDPVNEQQNYQNFLSTMERARRATPHAHLIAEYVQTGTEGVILLNDWGFSGVQGRDLKSDDLATALNQQNQAALNF